MAELSRDAAIFNVEPNYLRWVSGHPPDDTLFPHLWALRNTGQIVNGVAGTAGDDIKFMQACAMSHAGTNQVVVAVVDTGIDPSHPDLAASLWINSGETPDNGLDDDANGYADDIFGYDFADATGNPQDSGYHGTHVAGIIGATGNNQLGVAGVQSQARIMALKVSSDGETIPVSAEIDAIQYAVMMRTRGVNVAVINASFGGGGYSSTEIDAIQAAADTGIIFCAAAGNHAIDLDSSPFYPASYRLTNMIVVAATDQNDELAGFSNYGASNVDLAAPGVNILSSVATFLPSTTFAHPTAELVQGGTIYTANMMTNSAMTNGITATLYDCGLGFPDDFSVEVSNNIALISRGALPVSEKVENAMAAGAVAALIYNDTSGNFFDALQNPNDSIPTVSLSQEDGLALQGLTPTNVSLTTAYQFLKGTSMATPHVAGAVALAALNFPDESVSNRIQRILGNVDVLPMLSGLVRTGGRLNLQRILDADTNALPDWWESAYFGQLTGTNPEADPDQDGASNLAEWLAGTDPTNALSSLRFTCPNPPDTNGFVLQWPGVAGKIYRLQRSTNLALGFDTLVQSNILATPPTNSVTDTEVVPVGARFYRLQIEE